MDIAYPLIGETVPTWMLGIFTIPLPIIIILITAFSLRKSINVNYDLQTSILGLATSLAFTLVLTQIIKCATGSLRPDFLARCQPVYDPNDQILHRVIACNGDYKTIKEGRKSFFSGHSSFSHAALVYVSLYLSRHLNFRRPPIALKYIICLLPLVLAALIALSRVANYWHRWEDIVVGGAVGYAIAILSYRYHHPPSAPDAMGETDKLVGDDSDSEDDRLPMHTGDIDMDLNGDTLQLRPPVGHVTDRPFTRSPMVGGPDDVGEETVTNVDQELGAKGVVQPVPLKENGDIHR
ncbi:hypothetical protein HDV00_007774 [Rhizophlyctis rosea]|nr:hypothetical protein HDV00_007774 [Rhizophlyctis rosea]